MKAEVFREAPGALSREIWSFDLWTPTGQHPAIRLCRYWREERTTLRHKFRQTSDPFYSAGSSFDDWRLGQYLAREDVPLPDDVRAEARAKILDPIEVIIPKGNRELQIERRGKAY